MTGSRRRGPRCLIDEPMRVEPELVGQPLASPARRLAAFVVDWIVLWLPTVLVSLGAAALALRAEEPTVWRAIQTEMHTSDPRVRHQALKDMVCVLRPLARSQSPHGA